MARYILANQDQIVGDWVAAHITQFNFDPNGFSAIGLVNDSGSLIAGVIYEVYTGVDIRMHVAALPGKRWLTREFLGEVFRYPFIQLKCRRVTGVVPANNVVSARFNEHLGFILEGRMRHMLPNGDDVLIYGLLKEDCRFLNMRSNHGLSNRFPIRSRAKLAYGCTRSAI